MASEVAPEFELLATCAAKYPTSSPFLRIAPSTLEYVCPPPKRRSRPAVASTAGASVKVLHVTRAASAWQGMGGYGNCMPARRLRWQRERLACGDRVIRYRGLNLGSAKDGSDGT